MYAHTIGKYITVAFVVQLYAQYWIWQLCQTTERDIALLTIQIIYIFRYIVFITPYVQFSNPKSFNENWKRT